MHGRRSHLRFLFPSILFSGMFLLSGCGSSKPGLDGEVFIDNVPLEVGFVSFFPVEGTGNVLGAPVHAGRFQIDGIGVGKRKAVVSVTPQMEQVYEAGKRKIQFKSGQVFVDPSTEGNGQIIEIGQGRQQVRIHLRLPRDSGRVDARRGRS